MAKITRPKDPNERAKMIVDIATGEITDPIPNQGKNPAAVELGRLGGLKGGKARAAKLSPERRKEIAQKAIRARWEKAAAKKIIGTIENLDILPEIEKVAKKGWRGERD